jgi:hypothetical protein
METQDIWPRLVDHGSVSQNTRATNIQYPWFEASAPPFNRICPVCYTPGGSGVESLLAPEGHSVI